MTNLLVVVPDFNREALLAELETFSFSNIPLDGALPLLSAHDRAVELWCLPPDPLVGHYSLLEDLRYDLYDIKHALSQGWMPQGLHEEALRLINVITQLLALAAPNLEERMASYYNDMNRYYILPASPNARYA